jgi:iron only hydrogenase large subunit-like protein
MASVMLSDISDLGPSQGCIKPLLDAKKQNATANKPGGNRGAAVTIAIENDAPRVGGGHFNQIRLDSKSQTATVSLNDCLACSGCVTSAETVLINQQSTGELRAVVQRQKEGGDARLRIVYTISPQTRTALAHQFGLSDVQVMMKLSSHLKAHWRAECVLDTAWALDMALMEAQQEFVDRFKQRSASSSSSSSNSSSSSPAWPVLTSECPGWICYAEKTQGKVILPHISTVKSPQQIAGTFVKRMLFRAEEEEVPPEGVYHVCVMPCYDKKLEGARDDFYDAERNTRDVDLVLTTRELVELLEQGQVQLASVESDTQLLPGFVNVAEDSKSPSGLKLFRAPDHGGSGGYVENVFRYACQKLFGMEAPPVLQYKQGRNADWKELTLEVDGKSVLRFAVAYGFRNIKNVMNKIKRGKCEFDYVEIMACPAGCMNGGGQIKLQGGSIEAKKEQVRALNRLYQETEVRRVQDNQHVKDLYTTYLDGAPGSRSAKALLHTQYHALEAEDVNPLGIQW